MADLGLYRLGANPHEDALRMQRLYTSEGIDDRMMEEFGMSADIYATSPLPDLVRRIEQKYAGAAPPVFGVIAIYEDQDIGMAACAEKSFQDVESRQEVQGINVGAWLLKQYRARGFGRKMLEYVTTQAVTQSEVSGYPVWTSIKPENHASRRICEDIGFVNAGIQPDRPERRLYFLKATSLLPQPPSILKGDSG